MRTANIPSKNQAEYSWRGSYQRNSQNGQMQERTALGRLLNATIVVCGACYILYIAVYLGLDLKKVVARPLRDTVNVRLRLHSNPAPWDGQAPLQLHSAVQGGAPDAYADADGVNRISDFERTIEEPVPGVGMLADEKPVTGDGTASAGSSLADMSETAAADEQLSKDKASSSSAGKLSAADQWLEDSSSGEDSLKPKSPFEDIVEGSGTLLERAGEKESAAKESADADSFLQGLKESDLDREDDELSITENTGLAATSATTERTTAKALESDKDPFLLDSELAADRHSAGSSDAAAKPSAAETARAIALSAEDEPTNEDEDLEMLTVEDDPFLRDSGSESLRADREAGNIVGTQSGGSKADRAESERAGAITRDADEELVLGDEDSETLTTDDDFVLRDSGSSGLRSGAEERDAAGARSESAAEADAADEELEVQEEGYTVSALDEADEDWEDDVLLRDDELLEEDLLLEKDDAGRALDR